MIFLQYASNIAIEMINIVNVRYAVKENVGRCKQSANILGYVSLNNNKSFIVCTNRIILWASQNNLNSAEYINETIYHESVHAAQFCRYPNEVTLGIPWASMPLPPNKAEDVRRSVESVNPNSGFLSTQKRIEHEAYYLEDKPAVVKSFLKTYCL